MERACWIRGSGFRSFLASSKIHEEADYHHHRPEQPGWIVVGATQSGVEQSA